MRSNDENALFAAESAGEGEGVRIRAAVTFGEDQKKFFRTVRDGLFALIALLLFALSFAPVCSVRLSGMTVMKLDNIDFIAMMFDTACDPDDRGALTELYEEMEDVEEKLSDALADGRYAEADRITYDYLVLSMRASIRSGDYDGAEALLIVRGLIGLGMILFSFAIAFIYTFAFVRVLCGRERFPASRRGGNGVRCKVPGVLFAAYFMYLLLMLLTCVSGYSPDMQIDGAYAAALSFAALGAVVSVSGAVINAVSASSAAQGAERTARRRRTLGGAVAFCAAVITVGVMFAPDALTLRTESAKGSADAMFLNGLALTDESRSELEETLIGLSYAEKQAYMATRLDSIRTYIDGSDCEEILLAFTVAYDDENLAHFLAAGYYMLLLGAALVGAAGVCAVAGISDDGARKAWRGLIAAGAFAVALFIAACAVVAAVVNYNFDWLDLGASSAGGTGYYLKAGVGACGIASFLIAVIGAVAARLTANLCMKKEKNDGGEEEHDEEEQEVKTVAPPQEEEEESGFLAEMSAPPFRLSVRT